MPESQKPKPKTLKEQAEDIATSYVLRKEQRGAYRDEDEMIEERRMMREDVYDELMWSRQRQHRW